MFLSSRKYLTLTLLISGLLTAPAVYAENQGSQFSLSLDALGQGILIPDSNAVSFGGGGQAFLDWRPWQFISFGLGGQYAYFPMRSSFQLASFDLGGRIFPGATTSAGEFYLQGGLGRMLLINPGDYPGHYHGYAGLGWRQFLQKDFALDLGAQYDYYSPRADHLNAASAKLGLTFLFGRDDWSEPLGAPKTRARTLAVGKPWTGPSTYTWQADKDLRTAAYEIYGDEGLFPLLLDANKDVISVKGLRVGMVLKVPPPPLDPLEVQRIETRAFSDPGYVKWELSSQKTGEVHTPPVARYRWKSGDDLRSVALKLYGDEDLYPILVDANEKYLILPDNLVSGKVLVVPPLPADDRLDDIRAKSHDDEHYRWWLKGSLYHHQNIIPMHMPSPAE